MRRYALPLPCRASACGSRHLIAKAVLYEAVAFPRFALPMPRKTMPSHAYAMLCKQCVAHARLCISLPLPGCASLNKACALLFFAVPCPRSASPTKARAWQGNTVPLHSCACHCLCFAAHFQAIAWLCQLSNANALPCLGVALLVIANACRHMALRCFACASLLYASSCRALATQSTPQPSLPSPSFRLPPITFPALSSRSQ